MKQKSKEFLETLAIILAIMMVAIFAVTILKFALRTYLPEQWEVWKESFNNFFG